MPPRRTPLSIVHIAAPARFGGLETVLASLLPAQQEMGDRVCLAAVLTPGDADGHPLLESLEAAEIPVYPVVVEGRGYRAERAHIRRILSERGAHICHTHGYRPDVVDSPVARRMGVGTVSTVHGRIGGTLRGRLYEWLQVRAYRRFDGVACVSDRLREELTQQGVPAARVTVLRNAWEPALEPLPRAEARASLGLDADHPAIGWVGRLSPEKAPDVLLRAVSRMSADDTRVSFIGDGPMKPACVELADELGLAGRVRWHGSVPSASRLLPAFDVIVLSSWTEGTPMVLLEAMAAGVPIVATAVGGIPDVLSSAEGVLCDAGDEAGIARALDDILDKPAEADRRAGAARTRVAEDFATEPWAARYRELYVQVLEGR